MTKKEIIKAELKKLQKRSGKLKPEDVVDAASYEDHPLHEYFEWDDTEAAEQYRLEQARHLIRTVKVKFTDSKGGTQEIRTYTSTRPIGYGEGDYFTTEKVMATEALREVALNNAFRELEICQDKYEQLVELTPVFQALDKVKAKHKGKQKAKKTKKRRS